MSARTSKPVQWLFSFFLLCKLSELPTVCKQLWTYKNKKYNHVSVSFSFFQKDITFDLIEIMIRLTTNLILFAHCFIPFFSMSDYCVISIVYEIKILSHIAPCVKNPNRMIIIIILERGYCSQIWRFSTYSFISSLLVYYFWFR